MGIVTGSGGPSNQQQMGGLTGVAADGSGGMVEVYDKHGYKQYNKGELKVIDKAAKGDSQANDSLKGLGITLKNVSNDEGARSRNDLYTAGVKLSDGDKKKYKAFLDQQNAIGGFHQSAKDKITIGVSGLFGFGIGAGIAAGVLGNNYDGARSFTGKDGKLYEVSRTDGKSPAGSDAVLGKKAADGDEAAKAECLAKGLMVTHSDPDAALKRLDATPESTEALKDETLKATTPAAMGQSQAVRI